MRRHEPTNFELETLNAQTTRKSELGKSHPLRRADSHPHHFRRAHFFAGTLPEEFESSVVLKEWVSRNKNHKYVPQDLLEAWGFTVEVGL